MKNKKDLLHEFEDALNHHADDIFNILNNHQFYEIDYTQARFSKIETYDQDKEYTFEELGF